MLVTLLLLLSLPAAAEELPPPNVLGDHWFQSSLIFPTPFVASQASLGFSLGFATLQRELFAGTNLSVTRDLEVASFSPVVEGHFRVFERFSFMVGAAGLVVAGLNTASALIYGANTAYGARLGLHYELFRRGKTVLTPAILVDRDKTYAVSPLVRAIERIRTALGGTSTAGSGEGEVTTWRPSLRYAYGINRSFGLATTAELRLRDEPDDPSVSSAQRAGSRLVLTLFGDINLDAELGIPVALTAGYQRNQKLEENSLDSIDYVNFGISQAVTPRYTLGLEISLAYAGSQSADTFALTSRYYF
jgi:hypothetical protein